MNDFDKRLLLISVSLDSFVLVSMLLAGCSNFVDQPINAHGLSCVLQYCYHVYVFGFHVLSISQLRLPLWLWHQLLVIIVFF